MSIFGIEGGIGTGKTLTMITLMWADIDSVKHIYSNLKISNLTKQQQKKVIYLDKYQVENIFNNVKEGKMDLRNSIILLDEAHNFLDSRNSQSKKNKVFSYFVLQSRHFGEGSLDIIYTTQDLGQIDIRLRRQTDNIIHPYIVQKINNVPTKLRLEIQRKIQHEWRIQHCVLDCTESIKHYDTHEIIDFNIDNNEK